MPRLIITKGPDEGTDFTIGDEPVTFGRLATCEVTINDTKASRNHARIEARGGAHELVDLGSANGTLVNGRPVKKQRLYGGDVITIGTTDIRFQADAARSSRSIAHDAATSRGGGGAAAANRSDAQVGASGAGASSAEGFAPGDIQVKNAPLQYSKHSSASSGSFLRSDLLQEGGPLRWLLILGGFVVMAGVALGTAWLIKNVL